MIPARTFEQFPRGLSSFSTWNFFFHVLLTFSLKIKFHTDSCHCPTGLHAESCSIFHMGIYIILSRNTNQIPARNPARYMADSCQDSWQEFLPKYCCDSCKKLLLFYACIMATFLSTHMQSSLNEENVRMNVFLLSAGM